MTNRSRAGDRQNPRRVSATERAGVIREPIRGLHQGQQPYAAQTGRTHDCTRPASDVEIPLHRRARPHITPFAVMIPVPKSRIGENILLGRVMEHLAKEG
jgi:hypothetical protein